MTRLCQLPIKSLRLVQRTLSTGLKAAYWHINQQTNASITHVSSLHFLIHFIYPRLPYRQIMIQDLLNVCGFDDNVNLSDALLSLRVNIGKFTDCIVTDPSATVDDTPFILPNEVQSLRRIPTRFWQLCHKILQFREQRPSNLPVSVKGIHSWNLNSWSPGLPTNVHKTWIVKAMLKQAPVLLQETKWDQANLQYLSHTWPDIKVVATLAKHNPGEQAGVAILFPPGWKVLEERILVQHYAVAARVEYQACTIWLVSIYIPPSSPKAFVSNTLQTIIALTDYPVFVGGDFNRCDQNHFHTWDDFLVQAGLTDVDPALPTSKYQDQESTLDRFLVPSLFLDTTQLFARIYGRYRIDTCHRKALMLRLKMKPRLRPHPQSEKHHTIPTQVFLDPTIASESLQTVARQASLLALKRKISLAQETKPASVVLSHHSRAIVWSWWRTHSCHFKKLAPLKRLYKLLGKDQTHLHIRQEEVRLLYEQSGDTDLLQSWQTQQGCLLIPATVIASALQAAEVATATNTQMPFGTDNTDPVQRIRRQKIFWDRLKTVCPKGTFYHGPLLQHNGQECRTALEYDEAMLATRDFWFTHPVQYDRDWQDTLSAYRRCVVPWPVIPEPREQDYVEHLLLTKDSAPGPDGLPYALWRMFPQQTAAILQDDFHHILAGALTPPTQVGVWIPKAKQGPTADFFRPLGMPDTLDRLQDGTVAAILFRVTRHSFHPAQTLLNSFREPQRAVLEVQGALEGSSPASALFADLSKAFERINAHWILYILRIRQCSPWVLQFARYLLFGRRIRHKVQGRLLPARNVHSGVDMGRSTSVYFFCLAMDPIFVVLNQIPEVLVVAGYVDDTTIVGRQTDPNWVREVFQNIRKWKSAGIVMDTHHCWQVGFSSRALDENMLHKVEDVWGHVTPIHESGQATCSAALQHVPGYARRFVLRHGDHCIHMASEAIPRLVTEGHPMLCQLAASPCQCRSKTQLLTNVSYAAEQLFCLDQAGLGGQCIVPSTVNLGLTIHTGWTCQLTNETMVKIPLQLSLTTLLSKQLVKFRTRLAAANRANLSIHMKIIYFNTFSLSLFYYSQTQRFFSPKLLKLLYHAMADFLLQRHWFPQHLLVGLCRWLRIGPLLDPTIMQAVSLFGCYLRQGHRSLAEGQEGSYAIQIQQCWKYWQQQLPAEDIQRLLALLKQNNTPAQRASGFKQLFKQRAIGRLLAASHRHLAARICKNGWAMGPSILFLDWLADLPTTQVGAVPRYAVLRWALGEDADFWLPLRGKLSRSQLCVWCHNHTRCFPCGPGYGALCPTCLLPATPMDITLTTLPEESKSFLHFHQILLPEPKQLPPAFSRLLSSVGCRENNSYVPCVLCQGGYNSVDHWLSFCPVVHLTWLALWAAPAPEINWRIVPSRSMGVALCYMLFHLRRLVTEYGGLRPDIACLRHCSISHHVLDLWQRIYSSLPSTLINHFRAPPQPSSTACTDSTKIRTQRFPAVLLEAALLPPKGLATTQPFAKGDTIATFAKQDHRLRLLLSQHRKLPFPTATACLVPFSCHCGATHLRLQAMDDLSANTILLLGEPQEWQGCLVQFDGSAHKHTLTGGAGVSLLHVTPSSTSLVQWLSIPLLSCSDNVVAEAHACRAAINLAFEYYVSCMSKGIPIDSVVVQGDILPVINYLQYKGRIKKPAVVAILEQCQHLLARAPCLFRLVYLPRECNRLADYFAGQASAAARKADNNPLVPLHHVALPPFHLVQALGFIIQQGDATQAPAFVLTECPSPTPQEMHALLRRHPHYKWVTMDYIALAVSSSHRLNVGYKPTVNSIGGRFYSVGSAAQRLPRQARLLLFGNSHWEIDISGAHYELMRRQCRAAEVHLSLLPITQMRSYLTRALRAQIAETDISLLVKTWPLVIINSATPQEAIEYLHKRIQMEPSHHLVSFAREVFAASRYAMHHPPSWCPSGPERTGRGAPFHYFEVLEQQVTWAAYSFLQPRVGFVSAIWLHDGFWVAPRPENDTLEALNTHLCQTFGFDPTEPPLMRCDSLRPKFAQLLSEYASAAPVIGSHSHASSQGPLPEVVRIHRKRTFTGAHPTQQEALEQRLAKRIKAQHAKRRRT